MVKLQRWLLVALVLICALFVNVSSVNAHAGSLRHGVTLQSAPSHTSPTVEGEPDAGAGKEPPKSPQSGGTGIGARGNSAGWVGRMGWIRWTSGILMARYLGVSFRF